MWRSVVRSSGKLLTSYSSKAVQQRCLVTSSSYQDSRTYLTQPHAVRISWLKSAIMEVLPITTEVITSRGQTIDSLAIAVSYCPSLPPVYEEGDTVGKKRIDDSWIEMVLPFSEHAGLRDGIIEADGKTVRYGKLFEILDGLAADVGYRHSTGMKEELSIVTACVDEMSVKSNILITNDLKLQGYLTYVGKTSMEVAIEMISIDPNGGATYIGKSQFIMVARKGTKAAPICGLILADDAARKRFTRGQDRSTERRVRAANSLAIKPPRPYEINLIHSLYLESKKLESQNGNVALDESSTALDIVRHTWMRNTVFKNTQYMHTQNRNLHGKVFGGYIMRAAYELGWVAASCFMGQDNAEFIYVDEIQFVKSVNLGSIMEFTASVVYNEGKYVVVQVVAVDVSPVNVIRTKTNILTYVFRTKDGASANALPKVVPSTYEEIVLYLEGKRALDQWFEEQKQYY